ncbi:hypothetical protein BPNPMPFG_002514 [Mesorhizobium sp. AR07]|uniref:hypothetical protein n=1 Tax=Mesorhizobium sp. AR07 TaxID=2865838 RepID=UPI00215E3E5D|nr:hypothetical protein [Mesorhizobium sp. AR07]UVK46804.1 hypothetical protein BPNPMPFG_002514 [Mesorhizobium sp. AR07]
MPIEQAFIIVGVVAIVAACSIYGWLTQDHLAEWHVVERSRRVTLVDGTVSTSHYLLGRKINGVWSYRDLSADEYNTHVAEISL